MRFYLGQFFALAVAALIVGCGRESAEPSGSTPSAAAADPEQAAAESLRYDREFPAVGYSDNEPGDPVAELAASIARGEARLQPHGTRGYLDAVLASLDIDPVSQVLVFSKTSLQVEGVSAATPRAIYFNDESYVAWVPGAANLELAALDAELGPVFYTLSQSPAAVPERRFGLCLSCHDSYSLTGGGVPRFITGSGYIGRDGNMVAHEGWILTSDRTPLRSRWGGWYVSGFHGEQVHLGNIVVDSVYDLERLDSMRIGNIASLQELIDVSPYPADTSDIVALLVLEHQVTVQNALVRLNWDFRQALETSGSAAGVDVEPLVRALLFADTPALTDDVTGTAAFAENFLARGATDSRGRTLREFDLETRLFRYPLSYLIRSRAFAALPDEALSRVLGRIRGELTGADARLESLPADAEHRLAAWEILLETAPELLVFVAEQ